MSPRDALTVRPVRFTHDVPRWQTVLTAMGAVLLDEQPGRLVYQLAAGRLALHAASESRPAGTTTLALETTVPLAEAVAAAAAEGVAIELGHGEHGPTGLVRATDGTVLTLDPATPNPRRLVAGEPCVSVMPVWSTPDARVAVDVLDGLGLRRRVTQEDGSWADLTARRGGLHGVHPLGEVGAGLAFELEGDVATLHRALTAAGVPAELDDGGPARTLRFADPDGGAPLPVAERQPDLYGYALSEM
ncbi:hypothetical protein [Ornithinimicrobium avium]|uniref:VOC domain-containing protein n=1 Tax=Ornithinimicrobium avium TaxID=2283195 RepID=A0A345NN84_9MICO|nr:hypothetical protein [Ornithinimicrobium avium]AXH96492.1 hypothetical protein DV701_10465 [Ornithinimicrobium avium]